MRESIGKQLELALMGVSTYLHIYIIYIYIYIYGVGFRVDLLVVSGEWRHGSL